MMTGRDIPRPVAVVVGKVLGDWYYNHTRLNTLFGEQGAPGEFPGGNCVQKCQQWLLRCNEDGSVDALGVLGHVLEDFMTPEDPVPRGGTGGSMDRAAEAKRIDGILARYGFAHTAGRIEGAAAAPGMRSLAEAIRQRDLATVEDQLGHAVERVEVEPREAVTAAACSLLKSLFKCFIEDRGQAMPSRQEARALWKVVQKDLGLDPSSVEDEDVRRILSGLTSIVDGISALRTHAGSAHGRGRKAYRLEPRHARLAVNAAHTLALCVLDTWSSRENGSGA